VICAIAVTAEVALRTQNGEQDADIADSCALALSMRSQRKLSE
jgi:hypothetical protein